MTFFLNKGKKPSENAYHQIRQDPPDMREATALRALLTFIESEETDDLTPYVREKTAKLARRALIEVMDRVRAANVLHPK